MRSDFGDFPLVQHHDAVGVPDRREPVRDHKGRPPLDQPVQRLLDLRFRFHIERAGRLVKNQHPGIAQQRPRNRDALFLSAGQTGAVLLDLGVEPVRHRLDHFEQIGAADRIHQFEFIRIDSVTDVLPDRTVEQQRLLRHHGNERAVTAKIEIVHIAPVEQQPPGRRPDETDHQMRNRRFSGAGRPDECNRFSGLDMQIDVFKRVRLTAGILETDVFELEIALHFSHLRFARIEFDVRAFEHFAD